MDDLTHDLGAIDGDPFHAALFERPQQELHDCMEATVADVINEVTGTHLTDLDIAHEAENTPTTVHVDPSTGAPVPPTPMLDPSHGSTLVDAPALLAAHGVHAVYTDDHLAAQQAGAPTGMDVLRGEVSAGHHVIVSVDAEKLWDAIGVPHGDADGNNVDHALEVTGIDAATNTVYLNDTGQPNGADEAVPLSVFEQAWGLGGHAMVCTTDPDHPATSHDPLTVPGPFPSAAAPDPFASPVAEHPGVTTALIAGGAGAVAIGAAALRTKEARATAIASTAAVINRARTAATSHTDAAVTRTRAWIDRRQSGPATSESGRAGAE